MERMAAAGTGGDGNGVPTMPDHNGGTAEGRQDLGKILELLGREEPARSDQKRRPTAAIRSGAYLDFGKAAHVGFWTEWSGSQGAVERGDAARLGKRDVERGGARCGDADGGDGTARRWLKRREVAAGAGGSGGERWCAWLWRFEGGEGKWSGGRGAHGGCGAGEGDGAVRGERERWRGAAGVRRGAAARGLRGGCGFGHGEARGGGGNGRGEHEGALYKARGWRSWLGEAGTAGEVWRRRGVVEELTGADFHGESGGKGGGGGREPILLGLGARVPAGRRRIRRDVGGNRRPWRLRPGKPEVGGGPDRWGHRAHLSGRERGRRT
uniref:Uncharacterized protein K0098B12.8 n=1 Tax=Oryza sativa subsp. indica TaxID=39946 RepID=C8TF57_ORYSI|nr:hypothetical protein [Oryza sativa Indica Group]BAI39817.1 hypothetical protein [Oryza sativa Indica Group]